MVGAAMSKAIKIVIWIVAAVLLAFGLGGIGVGILGAFVGQMRGDAGLFAAGAFAIVLAMPFLACAAVVCDWIKENTADV